MYTCCDIFCGLFVCYNIIIFVKCQISHGGDFLEYILRTSKLTKTYGSKHAVDMVSMQIKKGEIYGFIGKNGAGKTTLMRLILGTATPDIGKIELFGNLDLNAQRHRIGTLLEYPCLYKNCSAFENLKRFAVLTGSSDKSIELILKLVGLGDVGNKHVGDFSLGMKQRLGIGIALLGNPEFLVLDEPINGLDPAGIKEIRDLILMLNRDYGVTFLISSHLLDELAKIVTTYGIIRDGKLIEQITAEELRERCRHQLCVTVDDTEKALDVISSMTDPENISVDGNTLYLYSLIDRSAELNSKLVAAGVNVSSLLVQSDRLEEYFIERLGR